MNDRADAFRAASRLSPERPTLRFHLAAALFRAGQAEQALRILAELDRTASGSFREEVETLRDRIMASLHPSPSGIRN